MRYHRIVREIVAAETAVMPTGLPNTHCTSGMPSDIADMKTSPPDITAAIFICIALRTYLRRSTSSYLASPIKKIAAINPHKEAVNNPMVTENQLSQLKI